MMHEASKKAKNCSGMAFCYACGTPYVSDSAIRGNAHGMVEIQNSDIICYFDEVTFTLTARLPMFIVSVMIPHANEYNAEANIIFLDTWLF
jgi:hypothetical protein